MQERDDQPEDVGRAATIAPKAMSIGDAPTLYGAPADMGHDPTLMKVDDAGVGHDPTLMKVDDADMGHDPTLMGVAAEASPVPDARGMGHDPTLMRVDAVGTGHGPGLGYERMPSSKGRSSSSWRVRFVAVLGAAVLVALVAWAATRDERSPEIPAAVVRPPPPTETTPVPEEATPHQPPPEPDRPSATEERGDEVVEKKGGGRRRTGRRFLRRIGVR